MHRFPSGSRTEGEGPTMSDEKKNLPVFCARAGNGKLGDQLMSCAHVGMGEHGHYLPDILKDHLTKDESRTVGQSVLTGGDSPEIFATNVLAHVIGAPAVLSVSVVGLPLAPVAFLYGLFDRAQSENRLVRVTVVNGFDQPINAGPALMRHGDEIAQCAAGYMTDDGKIFIPSTFRQVPGKQVINLGKASFECYGVGMFLFERHTTATFGWYGAEGVMTFSSSDPKFGPHTVGFAFVNGYRFDVRCALAPDLGQYGSLEGDHLEKTMDKYHTAAIDDAKTRSNAWSASVLPSGKSVLARACLSGDAWQGTRPDGDPIVEGSNCMVDFVVSFQPNA